MVVDTSVLVAIVLGEHDAESLLAALMSSPGDVALSAVGMVEASIVVEARQGPDATRDLQLLLDGLEVSVVPVDKAQATAAIAAWQRFGKGRHPAKLNLGDCFSYALAHQLGDSLLFKGHDFAQTDVVAFKA